MQEGKIFLGRSVEPEYLELKLANRHGLVTGATGTGKTVSLQVLAEGFSAAGVPVFAADIKGDLSGISAMAGRRRTGSPSAPRRSASTTGPTPPSRPCSGTCSASRAIPIRATVQEMGPLLLSRLLELNETQEGVLNIMFRVAADEEHAAARPQGPARAWPTTSASAASR